MRERRTRKSISQINVVPYIDVMLVLLVIFMITAPLLNPGIVNLPSVGKSGTPPAAPLEVLVHGDGSLMLRDRSSPSDAQPIDLDQLVASVKERLKAKPDMSVVISADKEVRYAAVMRVMDALQEAGTPRVGLLVKPVTP